MKSLLIQDFVGRECKHTFDKQFWLLATTVVVALNYGPTEKKKIKGHFFYGLLSCYFSRFSSVCIRWRYKKYSLELRFCLITGIWCWIGFHWCGCPYSLTTVDSLLHFSGRSKSSFTGTNGKKYSETNSVFSQIWVVTCTSLVCWV